MHADWHRVPESSFHFFEPFSSRSHGHQDSGAGAFGFGQSPPYSKNDNLSEKPSGVANKFWQG